MKKRLVISLVLSAVAVAAAVAGILLGKRKGEGDGGSLTGPTVLVWRVDGPVVEQALGPAFPFGGDESDSKGELFPACRAARTDGDVQGLAVYVQGADFGLAKAQELRRQLSLLRHAGKFVECYL